MKEFAIISQMNTDIGFGLRIKDDSRYDEAKKLAEIGFDAWNYATDPEEFEKRYGREYFTADDVAWFYNIPYTEPTEMLLDRFGIECEFVDCFDDENEIIQDDVIWY